MVNFAFGIGETKGNGGNHNTFEVGVAGGHTGESASEHLLNGVWGPGANYAYNANVNEALPAYLISGDPYVNGNTSPYDTLPENVGLLPNGNTSPDGVILGSASPYAVGSVSPYVEGEAQTATLAPEMGLSGFDQKAPDQSTNPFGKLLYGVKGAFGADPTLADQLTKQAVSELNPAQKAEYDKETAEMKQRDTLDYMGPASPIPTPMHSMVNNQVQQMERQIANQVQSQMSPTDLKELQSELNQYDVPPPNYPPGGGPAGYYQPKPGPEMQVYEKQIEQATEQYLQQNDGTQNIEYGNASPYDVPMAPNGYTSPSDVPNVPVGNPGPSDVPMAPNGYTSPSDVPNVPSGNPDPSDVPNVSSGNPAPSDGPNVPSGNPDSSDVPNVSSGNPDPSDVPNVPNGDTSPVCGPLESVPPSVEGVAQTATLAPEVGLSGFDQKAPDTSTNPLGQLWYGMKGLVGADPTLADQLTNKAVSELTPSQKAEYDKETAEMTQRETLDYMGPASPIPTPMHNMVNNQVQQMEKQIANQVQSQMSPTDLKELQSEWNQYDVPPPNYSPGGGPAGYYQPKPGPEIQVYEKQIEEATQQYVQQS